MPKIFPLFICITLLFVLLKATDVVAWSWFIVFSPMLLLFGIATAFLVFFAFTTMGIAGIINLLRK